MGQAAKRRAPFQSAFGAGTAVVALATSAPAAAQDIRPIGDLRLRYENVDQEGLPAEADALTARLRAGVELRSGEWSLLAEGEGTAPLNDRYDGGLDSNSRYPFVADPANVELNRLQLQYRGLPKTLVTVGRQRINLDDQRFVGASGWRQNEQTFDAVRVEYSGIRNLEVDATYAWSDLTIWGTDGMGARQQAISGNNVFANLAWAAPVGKLAAFAYLVDQNEAAVQNYQLSSQSYGVRLAGDRALGRKAGLSYTVSYARQSDYRRNPNDYAADYWLVDLGLSFSTWKFGLGRETLGADRGAPFTSFQTPLATLHKFQGWADKFTATPPNGVEDSYASIAYARKKLAGFDEVSAAVIHHHFRSARLDQRYGEEWDAQLSGSRGPWTIIAKLAAYESEGFATDTGKFWLQLEWVH